MRPLLCALLAGCVVGCMTPGGGKTRFELTFDEHDNVTGDVDPTMGVGAEYGNRFHVKVEAPAGVKIEEIVNFDWKWSDAGGQLLINTDRSTDTTAQAAALVEMTRVQASAFAQVVSAVGQYSVPWAGLAVRPPPPPQPGPVADLLSDPALRAAFEEFLRTR